MHSLHYAARGVKVNRPLKILFTGTVLVLGASCINFLKALKYPIYWYSFELRSSLYQIFKSLKNWLLVQFSLWELAVSKNYK